MRPSLTANLRSFSAASSLGPKIGLLPFVVAILHAVRVAWVLLLCVPCPSVEQHYGVNNRVPFDL
eukprot:10176044-Prorocentrum_lima.AAC.1